MIVQCPSCSARYRVNEQNIPATGGRISCPSCQHTFIVYPESAAQAPAAPPVSYDGEKTSVATDINALVAGLGGHASSPATGDDGATEVISGDALANFGNFGSFEPPEPLIEDGTVEMQNPLTFIKQNQDLFGGGELGDAMTEMTMDESSLKTEVASGLDFNHMLPSYTSPTPPARPPVPTPPVPTAPAPPVPTAPTPPAFGGGPSFNTGPRPVVPATPQQAPPAQPASPPQQPVAAQIAPPAAGPNPAHAGPWKLKTDFGLTYEFQDTRSLTSWMSGRESLDNYELSAGDELFFGWASFPQISAELAGASGLGGQSSAAYQTGRQQPVAPSFPVGSSSPSGGFPAAPQAPSAPMFGVPSAPTSPAPPEPQAFGRQAPMPTGPAYASSPTGPSSSVGKPVVAQENFSPPSRDAKWNVLLWVLFIMLAVGCLALAAQIFGFVDFKQMLGVQANLPTLDQPVTRAEDPTPTDPPETTTNDEPSAQEPPPEDLPTEVAGVSDEDRAMATTMIEDARAEMEANHLSSALKKLESALVLDPRRAQIYMLLAQVYEQLGQEDKAKEMRDTMQSLNADDMKMEEGGAPIMP
jgi:predicted Zn finger-like uncharacterized protein